MTEFIQLTFASSCSQQSQMWAMHIWMVILPFCCQIYVLWPDFLISCRGIFSILHKFSVTFYCTNIIFCELEYHRFCSKRISYVGHSLYVIFLSKMDFWIVLFSRRSVPKLRMSMVHLMSLFHLFFMRDFYCILKMKQGHEMLFIFGKSIHYR